MSATFTTDRRLRLLLLTLMALCTFGVLVFRFWWELDLIDSIYFTLTIITTTGFGDIRLLEEPASRKLFGIAFLFVGATALTITFAIVTDVIVSARLARAWSTLPRRLHDHVIVCGLGNIGFRVVERLAGIDVPVVAAELEASNRFLQGIRRLDVPLLIGDVRLPETLQALRVDRARCLVVATSSDMVNLETALNARAIRPDLRIVLRLLDPDLAERVERAFGIHVSRSPSTLAAPTFAAAAVGEDVIATIPAGQRVLLVARVHVGEGSQAEGRTLADLDAAIEGEVLLLDTGQGPRWRPARGMNLEAGQELVVVVTRQGLAEVLARTEPLGAHA